MKEARIVLDIPWQEGHPPVAGVCDVLTPDGPVLPGLTASDAEMARTVAPILATLPPARLREVLVKERPLREKEIDRVLAEMVSR